ncbi:MAG: class I SAM-dependent methyltransferase, partial [Chloroflexi bacterium]|nr:class I SAM-dependent methyltransferase [Chloroflexota bacterium]
MEESDEATAGDIKGAVRRQFGAVAVRYATSAVHAGGPDLEALAGAVPEGVRVLDVGCGAGHTALTLAPRVASVVAIDLTDEMLDQGRRLAAERGLGNVRFVRGDAERLDYPDASFDVVTSRYSAHHFPHPARALAEIA